MLTNCLTGYKEINKTTGHKLWVIELG